LRFALLFSAFAKAEIRFYRSQQAVNPPKFQAFAVSCSKV
jgi:hypothetical protein